MKNKDFLKKNEKKKVECQQIKLRWNEYFSGVLLVMNQTMKKSKAQFVY